MKHGAHQTDEAYAVSLVEDFCKSPTSPAGYMVFQRLSVSDQVCESVRGCGTPVLNMSSRLSSVTGNEAGVGGGLRSGVNIGPCKPILAAAPAVRANGELMLRDGTILEMNCHSPDGPGNTIGKIFYLASSTSAKPDESCPPLDNPEDRFVDIDFNDIRHVLGAMLHLPIAALLRGVAMVFPEFGQFLAEKLPQTALGTGEKELGGILIGNNDGNGVPGVLGIAMSLVHLENKWLGVRKDIVAENAGKAQDCGSNASETWIGPWGDTTAFEKGGDCRDCKTNPSGKWYLSFAETLGQGFGILARRLGVGSVFCRIIGFFFGGPNESGGFVRGVFAGAHVVP